MNATPETLTDKQQQKLAFLALNAMKDGPCKKVDLTYQANWNKLPSKAIHRVVNGLILEGAVDVYKDPEYKKRGPVPLMFEMTGKGRAKLMALKIELTVDSE